VSELQSSASSLPYPLRKACVNFTSPSSLLLRIHPLFPQSVLVEAMRLASIFKRLRNLGQGSGQKDSGESKREQDGGPKDGAVALPAPPSTGTLRLSSDAEASSLLRNSQALANVQPQSSEQGDVGDSTKPSSNVTESRVPPSSPPVTDAGVTPPTAVKEPHQPVTTSTQETPDGPKPGAKESQPATEYPDLPTS